jgi:hypothetical protein
MHFELKSKNYIINQLFFTIKGNYYTKTKYTCCINYNGKTLIYTSLCLEVLPCPKLKFFFALYTKA